MRTFYIYQAFLIAPAAWAQANDALHAEGITTFAQTAFVGQAVVGHFSGLYTYDIVTWSAGKFPGSAPRRTSTGCFARRPSARATTRAARPATRP